MTAVTLTPQIIGRAENAHKPLMDHVVASTGTTFHQWVTLTQVRNGPRVSQQELAAKVGGALKIGPATAEAVAADLLAAGLLRTRGDTVQLTPSGQVRYDRVRAAIDEVMSRVYNDIPRSDLETAGRVLSIITERADAEALALGSGSTAADQR